MANYSGNRNNQKKVNTTTRIISLFNREGDDAGALQLGYWNNMATLAIAPMLPAKKGQDATFDFEGAPSVVINGETIVTLQEGIELLNKDIARVKKDPEKLSRKVIYVSVECQVQGEFYRVEVGHNNEEREVEGYYLALAVLDKNDEEADVMVFPFDFEKGDRNQTLFVGTPKKEIIKNVDTQFKAFCNFISLSATVLNVAHAQGANINTDWKHSRVDYALELIKGLLESNIVGGGGGRAGDGEGGSGRRSGGFGSGRGRRSGGGRGRGGDEEETSSSSRGGRGRSQRTSNVKEEKANDINDIENELEDVDIDDM